MPGLRVFTCPYCPAEHPTRQGLRSHLQQTVACLEKYYDQYLGGDSSDSDAGDNSDDEHTSTWGDGVALPADDLGWPGDTGIEDGGGVDDRLNDTGASGAAAAPTTGKRTRETVEGVADEDDRWTADFPEEREAGKRGKPCKNQFEKRLDEQQSAAQAPWNPFENKDEWELGKWLMTSGVSQGKIEEFLKLDVVKTLGLSFHNVRAFLQRIDALPSGPQWICHPLELTGDMTDASDEKKSEIVEVWYRDPVDCVRELVGDPLLANQGYQPCHVFRAMDGDGNLLNQEYSEMWTANWWWETQEKLPDGATLCPIILASDKTQLTRFSGDKEAWPVYLTIGNIDKETRRAVSSRASILVGYIPVTKLEVFSKEKRSEIAHQLFHDCMRIMLAALVAAGEAGVEMECADGFVRHMFLILAAYVADYPEQCLIVCCRENSCPRCLVAPKSRGNTEDYPWRDPAATLQTLAAQRAKENPPDFVTHNLRPIQPFWSDFPHCNIISCMTPDLLHEIHNGVFGDHIVSWSSAAMDGVGPEIDKRFRAMTPHPSLRHFKKGITLTSQWTGTEHKNMEKVYLGVLANATDPRVICAIRGALDFTCYAHFEVQTVESLALMDRAWAAFHENKAVFIELGIRKDFDINKLHKLKHYTDSIRSRGTADAFSTERTERLHIDFAKLGYKASNRKAHIRQMAIWLRRQEAIRKFQSYLEWAIPGYATHKYAEDDDDDEDEPPTSGARYYIAKNAPFPSLTAATIAANFGAPNFLRNLTDFLGSRSIRSQHALSESSTFAVYKRFSLTLPQVPEVSSRAVSDKVRATASEHAKITYKGATPAKPPQFDTVLIRVERAAGEDSRVPNGDVRAARVRVIFRLPAKYGNFSQPLAYVDWYRPLNQFVEDLGMYQLTLATRNHQPHSTIIPVGSIISSCHLIPIFGHAVNLTWTSALVLDQCKNFYLNPYLRHHDFYFLRHLPDLFAARKKEDERRVRMKQLGRAGRH
ncbi:hypothetical protein GGX14DRAFT_698863 [Mycena pura]|uniref:C2H2-type domain-containing protein n=1 Tax=Mycena pura TaxID=153505 RepID=A0AAD6V6B8_9AGAR|nr:hypothetical protein GGX14DRAFT_698863 [Mycena pura]